MIFNMNDQLLFNKNEKKALLSELGSGRLSHAYLIEGEEGSGKTYLAMFAARALLCVGSEKPCGKCAACRKLDAGAYPDLFYYSPEKKATIGVDTVRDIKKSVYLMPNDGEKKVYIIDEAQKMTPQAQNALLKFLEEPPESAVFFIVTDKKESMLPTVVSRTRVISTVPASDEDIALFLKKNNPREDGEQIASAVRMADGSPGRALKLLKKDFGKQRQLCLDFVPVMLGTSAADIMAFLLSMKLNRDALKEFFCLLLTSVCDLLNVKCGVTLTRLLTYEDARILSAKITDKRISYLADIIMDTVVRLTENANINLLLTSFASKISEDGSTLPSGDYDRN